MLSHFLRADDAWLIGEICAFSCWLLLWTPVVALLEYAAHRWIMHTANHKLDPGLTQLKAHGKHHKGDNCPDFVDVPLRNTLRLTAPFFLAILAWGLFVSGPASTLPPAAALLAWTLLYVYLWNRMHRAIHGIEKNWFRRSGPVYRFYRRHHLRHHHQPRTNFGTVFPLTDYVFFTWAASGRGERTEELLVKANCADDGVA